MHELGDRNFFLKKTLLLDLAWPKNLNWLLPMHKMDYPHSWLALPTQFASEVIFRVKNCQITIRVRYPKLLYLCLGMNKCSCYLKSVLWFFLKIFLKILFKHFTSHCSKCLFHMNNRKYPAGWMISVERILRWTEPWGNINKKAITFYDS